MAIKMTVYVGVKMTEQYWYLGMTWLRKV